MKTYLPFSLRRIGWAGALYLVSIILLFLYSYTQVDLSLTLSGNSLLHGIQTAFQRIGYFERPLSTGLFCGVLALMFAAYGVVLVRIRRGRETLQSVLPVIVLTALLLAVSYPAFSYDLFNYLFTARTVLIYHENPYVILPLAYNGVDPYLSFMHWTHLPSAYSPLWIAATVPLYLLSGNVFLVSMWTLKLFLAGAYLAACWAIWRLTEGRDGRERLFALVAFAFNPLVVIESLVSSHNDILMMALALVAVAAANRGKLTSWVVLALSAATKTMTVFLIPAFFRKWDRWWMLGGMLSAFILVQFQREVLAWYWVWVMPFVALFPDRPWMTVAASGVSLGLLLRYAPFLYFGNWDPPVPTVKIWVTLIPVAVSFVAAFFVARAGRTGRHRRGLLR